MNYEALLGWLYSVGAQIRRIVALVANKKSQSFRPVKHIHQEVHLLETFLEILLLLLLASVRRKFFYTHERLPGPPIATKTKLPGPETKSVMLLLFYFKEKLPKSFAPCNKG